MRLFLAEYLPLEQGLRLTHYECRLRLCEARRASSIRTRIKTCGTNTRSWNYRSRLAEHLPLEQGCQGERLERKTIGETVATVSSRCYTSCFDTTDARSVRPSPLKSLCCNLWYNGCPPARHSRASLHIATRLALTGIQIATHHGEHESLCVSFFIIFAEKHIYNSFGSLEEA